MSVRARLHRNWERVRTEPGLKKNVVVIAILLVLATAAGGWVLGNQRFDPPWANKYEISAEFEAVPGIAPGNGQEVRMNGVIVGQIVDAKVGDDGHAVVTMKLDPDQHVYRDATLVLRPKSPLNEMYVEIDPGGPPAAVVPSGGTLPLANTRRPVEIDEVLDHLDDQSRAALTTLLSESDAALAHAPRDLPAGLDATSKVATDLRPVLRELDRRHAELRSLVTSLSAISTAVGGDDRRLTSLASGLDGTLSVVAARSGSLDATLRQLPAFTRRLGSATRSVSALTRQLDPTLTDLQRASGVLPGALDRLKSTVGHLATTVRVARPVVRHARPVVADLRPVSAQLRSALPTLEHTTGRLDPVTALLTRYLPDLGAFVVDTRSLVSLRDANGGILRGLLTINTTSDPSGLLAGLSPNKVKGPKG